MRNKDLVQPPVCEYGDKYGNLWFSPKPSKDNGYQYPVMQAIIADVAKHVQKFGLYNELIKFRDTDQVLWFKCNRSSFYVQSTEDGGSYYFKMDRSQLGETYDLQLPHGEATIISGRIVTKIEPAHNPRHPNFYARATMPYIVDYFNAVNDKPISCFKADWRKLDDGAFGDNIAAFNAALQGLGKRSTTSLLEEAAKLTPTGKIVTDIGFNRQIVVKPIGTSIPFSDVTAYFFK